ncbi:hypothetical protein Tco_0984048 [Tanacetum coccineum]
MDHHRTPVVNGGAQPLTTAGPPVNHRRTTGQPSGQTVATAATWHATSACRSHVSLRGSATSADWVPLAYVAATSDADVAEGILTLLQARTRDLEVVKLCT